MARAYTRTFSDVAFANRIPSAGPSIAITGGNMRLVRLAVGSEGRVTDITVKQEETEDQVAFTVDLLKSKITYPFVDQDFPVATLPADTLALYRVLPAPISVLAGDTAESSDDEIGFNYKNMDGSYTNNQQYLYLLITPTADGTTTWKVSITVERDAAGQ